MNLKEEYLNLFGRFIEPLKDKAGKLSEENTQAAIAYAESVISREPERFMEQHADQFAKIILNKIFEDYFYRDKSRMSAAMYHLWV